jgi:hypothetical protein
MIRSDLQRARSQFHLPIMVQRGLLVGLLVCLPLTSALAQKAKEEPAKLAATKPAAAKATPAKPAASKPTASKPTAAKPASTKPAATKPAPAKPVPAKPEAVKPALLATFGEWGAYMAGAGAQKTCYVLAQPKERLPAGVNRDPAFAFISTRPGQAVRNEISITMGFDVKKGTNPSMDIVGGKSIGMTAKGSNLWIKNAAEEPAVLESLKKGTKLNVKATSLRNRQLTDVYVLTGLAQALERLAKECP